MEIFPKTQTLNFRGKLLSLERPLVMGILNLTPDSFSDGGLFNSPSKALEHAGVLLRDGADILDIGGYSSRPGASDVPEAEELERIDEITKQILKEFPDTIVSIDTFRSGIAEKMLDAGVHMINDISAGYMDAEMLPAVARWNVPYIAMHMPGTPQTMQQHAQYENVVNAVWDYFVERINACRAAGLRDLVLDPGFGFGKNLQQNYDLFHSLDKLMPFGLPVLVGISRKAMIRKKAGDDPSTMNALMDELHLEALKKGVSIFRVHDVGRLVKLIRENR